MEIMKDTKRISAAWQKAQIEYLKLHRKQSGNLSFLQEKLVEIRELEINLNKAVSKIKL